MFKEEITHYCPMCEQWAEKYKAKEQECEELKNKYHTQLNKNLEKQCRINELQNIVLTKEFILKVNGKKYTNLSGIDKARLFINHEINIRNKKILELENEISSLQWKFYDNCKKAGEAQQQLDQLKQTLTEIKKIANKTLWTYSDLDDVTKYNMFDKILQKISECEGSND